jgi:hypothetical protein
MEETPRRSARLSKSTVTNATSAVVDTGTIGNLDDIPFIRLHGPKFKITAHRRSLRIAKRFKSTYGSDDDGDNNNNNDGENENYDASHLLRYSSSKKSFPHFDDHLMQNILSYVGEFQYRFIGGVNQSFQTSYVALYPRKETYCHASSIERAKYCWDDIAACTIRDEDDKDEQRRMLWYSAIRHGKKYVIMYLVEQLPPPIQIVEIRYGDVSTHVDWKNDWKFDLCCKAALYGHWELLQWACAEGIFVVKQDERVIDNAITSGHREIFVWAFRNGFRYKSSF